MRVLVAVVALVCGLAVGWWLAGSPRPSVAETTSDVSAQARPSPTPETPRVAGAEASADRAPTQASGLVVTATLAGRGSPGAEVEVWRQVDEASRGRRWLHAGAARTAPDGTAHLATAPGRFFIWAHAADGSALALADVPSGGVAQVTLALDAPGYRLEGNVVDGASGAPIVGAAVTAIPITGREPPFRGGPAEAHRTVMADGLGRFALTAPDGFEVDVRATAPGYAQTELHILDAARAAAPIRLEMRHAARAEGQVVDGADRPVADAAVSAHPPSAFPALTDAAGRFSVTLIPGRGSIHATGPDGLQAIVRLDVAAGETRRGVILRLGAGSDLVGQLLGPTGAPEAGASISVLAEPDLVELAHLETGTDGRFRAVQLPAGRYSVQAQSGDVGVRQVGVELPGAGPLVLRLAVGASLTGRVVDPDGQPVAGARAVLSRPKGLEKPPETSVSDAHGHFAFRAVEPGAMQLDVSRGATAAAPLALYLAPGQTEHVDIVLRPLARLVGRVVFTAPRAEPPGRLRVLYGRGPEDAFETDEAGRYDVALPAGHIELTPLVSGSVLMPLDLDLRAGETTYADVTVNNLPHGDMLHRSLDSGLALSDGLGGVTVSFLTADSPAAAAGLCQGDLLLSIDGVPVSRNTDALARLDRPRGAETLLRVRRAGRDVDVALK